MTNIDGHPFINANNHASKGFKATTALKTGKLIAKPKISGGLMSYLKKRKAK